MEDNGQTDRHKVTHMSTQCNLHKTDYLAHFSDARPFLTQRQATLRGKRVPKRCPWGTIASNSTLFSKGHSFFLNNHICGKMSTPSGQGKFS